MTQKTEPIAAPARLWSMKLTIASPCQAPWERMKGDDRARFCGLCKLNVYNLSGLTEAQAKSLLRERDGNVCVRFYRRADGTVLTQDCPVRFRTFRRRAAIALGALLAATAGFLAVRTSLDADSGSWLSRRPFSKILQWLRLAPPPQPVMGKPCPPPGQ